MTLPAGVTWPLLADAVRYLLDRHEILRTTFPTGADGIPIQRVGKVGEPAITTVPVPDDNAADAWRRARQLAAARREISVEPPLRITVGTAAGRPAKAVAHVHPVALDAVSVRVLASELEQVLQDLVAGRQPRLTVPVWQSVDHGLLQESPRMRHRNRRNLARWHAFYADAPATMLPFYWENIAGYCDGIEARLVSRTTGRLVASIARRSGASESAVIMAAYGLLLAAWAGHGRFVIGETVSLRFRPEMHAGLGRYQAITRVLGDVADDPCFDDLARRTAGASRLAHQNAICAEGELAMIMSRRSVERGHRIEFPPQFNYHYYYRSDIPHRTSGVEDELARVQFTPAKVPVPLPALDVYPMADQLEFGFRCGRHLLPGAEGAVLAQLAGILRAAAAGPRAPASVLARLVRLPKFWSGPEWVTLRGSWLSLADTARLLCRCPRVATARAFLVGPGRVVAFVVTSDAAITPVRLREHMRDAASTWPTALVPDHYVVCDRAPRDEADRTQWTAQDVVTAGDGRIHRRGVAVSSRETALMTAFHALHPDRRVNFSYSYAENHGDFLRIPALLGRLSAAGYHGIDYQDLLGMATLGRLAQRLRRQTELACLRPSVTK